MLRVELNALYAHAHEVLHGEESDHAGAHAKALAEYVMAIRSAPRPRRAAPREVQDVRVCARNQCGAPFVAMFPHRIYCSDICRTRSADEMRRARGRGVYKPQVHEPRECASCGTKELSRFSPNRSTECMACERRRHRAKAKAVSS